jgi:hypothetical protein
LTAQLDREHEQFVVNAGASAAYETAHHLLSGNWFDANSKEKFHGKRGLPQFLLVAAAFALTLVNVDLLSAKAQTQSAPQPAKVREVDFTYHTELTGLNPKADRVEAWIPLPREDRFQQVSGLRIDSPAHVEVVNQPTGGNRAAHLSAKVPPSGSIPVYDWLSAERGERGHNPRLSLLGGILRRRPMGSGGRIGSVEASATAPVLFWPSRRQPDCVHDGSRPDTEATPERGTG